MPLMESLLGPVYEHPSFKRVLGELSSAKSGVHGEVTLAGLTSTAKAMVVAGMARSLERPIVVLTKDNETAERLRETMATFLEWLEPQADRGTGRATSLRSNHAAGAPAIASAKAGEPPALPGALAVLPAFDVSPYEARPPHGEILEQRAVALWNIARGRTRVLFVPIAAALVRYRQTSFYGSLALELKPNDEVSPSDLVEHLQTVGYDPGEPVESVGQYSVRGGIVDVFSPESERPVRIEFFGDSIESLREFDPKTQRSERQIDSAALLPLAETPRFPKLFSDLVKALSGRCPPRHRRPGAEPDWAPEYSNPFPGWEFFVPLVEPHPNTLISLMSSAGPAASAGPPLLVWDEKLERVQDLTRTLEGLAASFDEVRDIVPPRPAPVDLFLTEQEFSEAAGKAGEIDLKELALAPGPGESVLPTQTAPKFHGAVKAFVEDVKARLAGGDHVVCVVPTTGKAERLREILSEYQVPFASAKDAPPAGAEPGTSGAAAAVLIVRGQIDSGVALPGLGLVFLSDSDLFGGLDFGAPTRREKSAARSFISDLSDLKVGDYVVHVDHGIGLYQGLRQLAVENAERDFMLLTYQEDAKLYVPLERLDLVEKYRASGDGAKPVLDRLGGITWARTKSRVKRALRDMAEELLRLYAERKMRGGVAYSPDTPWQQEFENAFEFEETPDQVTALADIKSDLESPQPMDRLLSGDVGYGKTELAMRAAFKVVQDGKQAAVLAPTTVLAFQHFSTFTRRLAAFPVRIEMASRFRSAAEIKRVLAETEAGKVDILIGTHRLLSKDVHFHDLGLLIVDEEQRFGVAAKERLKKLKAGVEVLTMSATPIPRTLNMSLGGLRDLSVIETPPKGRLAIQTVVAPFADGLVQAAILQEMSRQGQVYFVHNRVESIWSMASLVQKLVPTARIGVAHGQMHEKELERVMLKFIQGEYDVLVSTVLIENGLDIPRANTLIVNHAERFGLADLYQLRGRVGRSNRRAYAYFLIPAEDALTPIAKRRLAALKEFSDLGAGFRLAALDLELRGAGNLLGAEQSGHLQSVGIDLYLKMLEETVEELKGGVPQPEVRTTLNLGLDIKIPDEYIADERQRLRMYKRISSLATNAARADLEAELVDRYGPVPASVLNLFSYALLKSAAERLLVQSIERREDEVWLRFHTQAPVDPTRLTQFLRRYRHSSFRPDGVLRFRLASHDGDLPEQIQFALQELHS